MAEIRKITVIGAGCLGKALILHLNELNFVIHEIVSRKQEEVDQLCRLTGARANYGDYRAVSQEADLYIVSVKDDAVFEVRKQLRVMDKLIVHTSGTLPFDALKKCSSEYGIFYPLQSFSKNRKPEFKEIPLYVWASSPASLLKLHDFAGKLSLNVFLAKEDTLRIIHLAAVFASNFTNHLLKIAKDILSEKDLDFQILRPLVKETINKAFDLNPESAQTGPAKRGDCTTTDKHKNMLKRDDWRALYILFSGMIREEYADKTNEK